MATKKRKKNEDTYRALVTITLETLGGKEIHYERRCSLSKHLLAVPKNVIPLCKTSKGWQVAAIDYASEAPTYIEQKHRGLEIYATIPPRHDMSTAAHFKELKKELLRNGWKVCKTRE